jgi:two-component system, response regulator YesN
MSPLANLNILVVDDEQDLREAMADYFAMVGAKTFTAENGIRAQEILSKESIDVVFTDIQMPKCNGIELIKAINHLPNKPEVFVCSGAHNVSADYFKSLGVLEVFNKPFDTRELVNAIHALKNKVSKIS